MLYKKEGRCLGIGLLFLSEIECEKSQKSLYLQSLVYGV